MIRHCKRFALSALIVLGAGLSIPWEGRFLQSLAGEEQSVPPPVPQMDRSVPGQRLKATFALG